MRGLVSSSRAIAAVAVLTTVSLLVLGSGQPVDSPQREKGGPGPGPPRPLAGPVFKFVGDFESGNPGQWGLVQVEAADRAEVVKWPVTQGAHALRLTTRYGDVPSGSGSGATNRAQVNGPTIHQEGEEDFTRVSLRVPSGFPAGTADNDFQLAWQWHGPPWNNSSPPISLDMSKDRTRWQVSHNPFEPDGDVNSPQTYRIPMDLPLTKDVWHHFIFRVKWSRYAATGFFEVWHAEGDQEPVKLTVEEGPGAGGQRVYGPTLNSSMSEGVRPIATNYRRQETTRQAGTIFYDGIAVGNSYESVWPLERWVTPAGARGAGTPPE